MYDIKWVDLFRDHEDCQKEIEALGKEGYQLVTIYCPNPDWGPEEHIAVMQKKIS